MVINWPKLIRRKFTELFPLWHLIEYALLRISMAFINLFPITVSTWIAQRIGDITFVILPTRRRIAFENLTIAFGDFKTKSEKRKIALESFRHIITSFMEFARLPKFVKVSAKHIRFQSTESIDRVLARGKGLILVISHLGVWEYLGFFAYLKGYPSSILGRAIRNPYIYRWVRNLRELMNLKYIDKDRSPKEILSELKRNHGLAIAIDQWAGNEGIWVDFFGTPTSTTPLPARLAERTGAALIPAYCIRKSSGEYEIYIEPEINPQEDDNNFVENATRELNQRLEQKILVFPEQWTWTHRRWKIRNTKGS